MNPIAELSVWLEEMRPVWAERGVGVFEKDGATIHHRMQPDGSVRDAWVFVGSLVDCALPTDYEDFVALIVLGEISVEHSKVLIENAVEQVAGR